MVFLIKGHYILPEDTRHYFKEPLDLLLVTSEEIRDFINRMKKDQRNFKIITVGDVCTKTLLDANLIPDLAIVDEHVQRNKVAMIDITDFQVIEADNPAANITSSAWTSIQTALKMDDIKIIIKITGEEDLLVLPAIFETPYNSKVLYGQPNEGLVVVTVTEKIKEKVKNLIQKMVKINEN